MGRPPRHLPRDCPLVEVTQKTVRGQFLLRPDRAFNEIFLGCLGRAQRLYPVELMGVVCLSNHFHLLARIAPERCLSEFMWYFSSNLAKEVNRLRRTSGPVWSRRFSHVPIEDEPAQIARFKYLLSHGVKEHLVKRCRKWPGVHVSRHLLDGEELQGVWFDRTREYTAHIQGKKHEKYDFAEQETVEISQLPCMADLSDEEYRRWVKELVLDIETTHEAEREREGRVVLGVRGVKAAEPLEVPEKTKKAPIPRIHATTKAARRPSSRRSRCSWRPTGRRRRSCGTGCGTWCSRRAASRRPCRTSRTRMRLPGRLDDLPLRELLRPG